MLGVLAVHDEPPAIHHVGGAVSVNKCSLAVLNANRLQVLGRSPARNRQGWHEDPKESSLQSQPKGPRRRRSLANVEHLRKDDAQLLKFWAVAVDPC